MLVLLVLGTVEAVGGGGGGYGSGGGGGGAMFLPTGIYIDAC